MEDGGDDRPSGSLAPPPIQVSVGETLASVVRTSHFGAQQPYSAPDAPPRSARGRRRRPDVPPVTAERVAERTRQRQLDQRLSTPRQGGTQSGRPILSQVSGITGGFDTVCVHKDDSRGYGNFEDLLSGDWTQPHELRPPLPPGSPDEAGLPSINFLAAINGVAQSGVLPSDSAASSRRSSFRGSLNLNLAKTRPGSMRGSMKSLKSLRASLKGVKFEDAASQASSRPASSLGGGNEDPDSVVDVKTRAQDAELSSMLKELDIDMSAVTLSAEWASILRLAEGQSGLDAKAFDPIAEETPEDEQNEGKKPATEKAGFDGGAFSLESLSGRAWRRRQNAPKRVAPLAPGVYSGSNEDREPFRPGSVRGLPERGKRADMNQAKSKPVEAHWQKNDTKAWMRKYGGLEDGFDDSAHDRPRRGLGQAPGQESANAKGRVVPPWASEMNGEDDFALDLDKMESDRKALFEWKKKIAECAKKLSVEAQRFRVSND